MAAPSTPSALSDTPTATPTDLDVAPVAKGASVHEFVRQVRSRVRYLSFCGPPPDINPDVSILISINVIVFL
jgi:hypothetical protein